MSIDKQHGLILIFFFYDDDLDKYNKVSWKICFSTLI